MSPNKRPMKKPPLVQGFSENKMRNFRSSYEANGWIHKQYSIKASCLYFDFILFSLLLFWFGGIILSCFSMCE